MKFKAIAVLPVPGLAANIIKSPGWNPSVTLLIFLNPVSVPVNFELSRVFNKVKCFSKASTTSEILEIWFVFF